MLIKLSKKERAKELKVLMVRGEMSQAAIARGLNVTRSAVSQVVSGRLKTPRIRRAIADALGLKYERVWPETKRKKAA